MNEVYIIGKIITDIEYKFIINKKQYAIAKFQIKIKNNSIILVKSYNNLADKVLRRFHKNYTILIYGKINSKIEVIAKEISILNKN